MTYSEPMEGIGLLKFSVRENGMFVIGWLMDLSGQPLGVQAESRVRPPETTEAAVDRVRDRIRQKVLARTAEPPKAGGHLYTDAWRELQRRYPDRADLMRRLNGEYWNESTLRAAVSYLIHQILPRLDQLGSSPTGDDIAKLHAQLVEQASNSKHSLGVSARARYNLIGKLRRCDALYQRMGELLRDWSLPDMDLRMEGSRVPDVEQYKSLPEEVRIRFATVLARLAPTPFGGAALCLAFMQLCGLRTAESAALYFRDMAQEAGMELFWVTKQREGTELTDILKTANAYRRLPLVRFLSDMVEARRVWLRGQGFSNEQIMDLPLNGHPKNPKAPIDSGAISAIGRRLLQICGCSGREYWDNVRTLMAEEPDTTVSGRRMTDAMTYVLRRDFASRAANVCGISKLALDWILGHAANVPAHRKRAFFGIESMLRLRKELERYVFDPDHSGHPAFSPAVVEAEKPGSLPAYGSVRLVAKEDLELTLCASALDAYQPVHIQVSGGEILHSANVSILDLPEERHTRPLPGRTRERTFYEQIKRQAYDEVYRKAVAACEEVL